MASLQDIAHALVAHCRNGTEDEGLNTLYAEDAVSIEAADPPGGGDRKTAGLDGIRGKHAFWNENFDVHALDVEGPFIHGEDRFGVIFSVDASEKATGSRFSMKEIGLYRVKDRKIIEERFFQAD